MNKPRILLGRLIAPLLVILACFAAPGAVAGAAGVPLVQDLSADAKDARARHVPILVMAGAPDCIYCQRVLNEFLIPMSRNADYQAKVILRRIETRSGHSLVDFSGKTVSHDAFARAHHIKFTPTILLLGPDGQELAEPLVGLSTPDYYGAFLDQAIDSAREKLGVKP